MQEANPMRRGPSISTTFSTNMVQPNKTASIILYAVKKELVLRDPNILKDREDGLVSVVDMELVRWELSAVLFRH
jgi:hypothetical protein